MKIFAPPEPKPDFLTKKGVKLTKISKKFNQLGFGSNFQGKLEWKKKVGEKKLFHRVSQNLILWEKRDPKNQPNSDLVQIFRISLNPIND